MQDTGFSGGSSISKRRLQKLRILSCLALATLTIACAKQHEEPDLLKEFVAYRTEIFSENSERSDLGSIEGPELEKYFSRSMLEWNLSALINDTDPERIAINAGRIRRGTFQFGAEILVIHEFEVRKTGADRRDLIMTATVEHPPRPVLYTIGYAYESGAWRIAGTEKDMVAKNLNGDDVVLDFRNTN